MYDVQGPFQEFTREFTWRRTRTARDQTDPDDYRAKRLHVAEAGKPEVDETDVYISNSFDNSRGTITPYAGIGLMSMQVLKQVRRVALVRVDRQMMVEASCMCLRMSV